MTKESGIGMTLTVDNSSDAGQNISGDVTNVSFGTPRNLQDITGLTVASMERLALLGDGVVDISGVFNDALSHLVFKDIATNTATRTVLIAHSGQLLTMEILFADYSLSRAADGSLTYSSPGQLASTTAYGWTTP